MARRSSSGKKDYALAGKGAGKTFPAPRLPYRPARPKTLKPRIGLIGCGGITDTHLQAYRTAGYPVVALCDIDRAAAEQRRDDHFPDADVFEALRVLVRKSISGAPCTPQLA